ncbi:hypothetical protein SGLAM104S_10086 [Streptomyces glaucescens]
MSPDGEIQRPPNVTGATLLVRRRRTLLDAVRTKPDLGQLATNPLMCGLICALHRDRRGYLPHGRQELYDAALSMLLARRDEERDMITPGDGVRLTELPQIQLLQRLAYWLIRNNQSELDRERAVRIVADVLPPCRPPRRRATRSGSSAICCCAAACSANRRRGRSSSCTAPLQDYLGAGRRGGRRLRAAGAQRGGHRVVGRDPHGGSARPAP